MIPRHTDEARILFGQRVGGNVYVTSTRNVKCWPDEKERGDSPTWIRRLTKADIQLVEGLPLLLDRSALRERLVYDLE